MFKKDWLFAGLASLIIMVMILTNIWVMMMILSKDILLMVFYAIAIITVIFFLTRFRLRTLEPDETYQPHWINDHLLLWMMTDFHAIVLLLRYVLSSERQGNNLPEFFFVGHLVFVGLVLCINKTKFYQTYKLLLNFLIHLIIYSLLSYSFIQLVIQTMQ